MSYSIYARTKFAQSARKHRIGWAHVVFVMEQNEPEETINIDGETVLEWLGADDRGVELEVIAVVPRWDTELLMIIHVMPTHYRN